MGRKGFHILNDDILHILLHIDYGIFNAFSGCGQSFEETGIMEYRA